MLLPFVHNKMMRTIVLATSNLGKCKELKALLSPLSCISQDECNIPSVEETGLTFVENALLKARHASTYSNMPALADDSGLVVPALAGEPGIYSARYGGKNATEISNIELLLHKMKGLNTRSAYFYCVLVYLRFPTDPVPLIAQGKIEGHIHTHAQGDCGFGYDPIFYLPEYACTMAELSLTLKNQISHRAQALQQLREQLQHDYHTSTFQTEASGPA